MTTYSLVGCDPYRDLFIDTDKEDVALAEARTAYNDVPEHVYVLYRNKDDHDSEPTHIVLHDVAYALVDTREFKRLELMRDDFLSIVDTLQAAIKEFGIDVPAGRRVDQVIVQELRRHIVD